MLTFDLLHYFDVDLKSTYDGTFLRDSELYVNSLALKKVAQDVSLGSSMGIVDIIVEGATQRWLLWKVTTTEKSQTSTAETCLTVSSLHHFFKEEC